MSAQRVHEIRIDRNSVNDEFVEIVVLLKADGSPVAVDDPLLEYETSKGTVVVTADAAGIFRTRWTVGSEVPMSAILGVIEQTATETVLEGDAR